MPIIFLIQNYAKSDKIKSVYNSNVSANFAKLKANLKKNMNNLRK